MCVCVCVCCVKCKCSSQVIPILICMTSFWKCFSKHSKANCLHTPVLWNDNHSMSLPKMWHAQCTHSENPIKVNYLTFNIAFAGIVCGFPWVKGCIFLPYRVCMPNCTNLVLATAYSRYNLPFCYAMLSAHISDRTVATVSFFNLCRFH